MKNTAQLVLVYKILSSTDEELIQMEKEPLDKFGEAGVCFTYCSPEEIREWAKTKIKEEKNRD